MNRRLEQLLASLAESVDGSRQRGISEHYHRALDWKSLHRCPLVLSYPWPDCRDYSPYPHGEAIADPEKMLYNELVYAFGRSIALHARGGADDLPYTVRANFGTVLGASMFGALVEQHGDNPPWVRQTEARIHLREIPSTDPTDFSQGWIPRVVETMQLYEERLGRFPELRQAVRIVLPDLQGPFDNLELICGSDVYLKLVLEPMAVDDALSHLAQMQIELFRYLSQWIDEDPGFCHQHGLCLRGNILLRNDSCILVSPEMYRTQIAPHDEEVLRSCGGGGVHACGSIEHLVDAFLALPSLRSLDFGQAWFNDVDAIYRKAAGQGVPLIRLTVSPEDVRSGRAFACFPTGAVLLCRTASFTEASSLAAELEAYPLENMGE